MLKFSLPALYPIVNVESCPEPAALIDALLLRTPLLQIRSKADRELLRHYTAYALHKARELGRSGPAVIVNDDVELCIALGAQGVHLGQDDFDPIEARERLGQEAIIGFSTHSLEQFCVGQRLPVDYLGFGPIFTSGTKHGHAAELGLGAVTELRVLARKPFTAIGGVSRDNAQSLFRAGAPSVAVIGDLERDADPAALIGQYEALKRSAYAVSASS